MEQPSRRGRHVAQPSGDSILKRQDREKSRRCPVAIPTDSAMAHPYAMRGAGFLHSGNRFLPVRRQHTQGDTLETTASPDAPPKNASAPCPSLGPESTVPTRSIPRVDWESCEVGARRTDQPPSRRGRMNHRVRQICVGFLSTAPLPAGETARRQDKLSSVARNPGGI